MKNMYRNRCIILFLLFAGVLMNNRLVAQEDSLVPKSVVKLHYFNSNNSLQYLLLESMLKRGKTLTPQKNKAYEIYLDSGVQHLVATVTTDESGKAKAFIPPSLKADWEASP